MQYSGYGGLIYNKMMEIPPDIHVTLNPCTLQVYFRTNGEWILQDTPTDFIFLDIPKQKLYRIKSKKSKMCRMCKNIVYFDLFNSNTYLITNGVRNLINASPDPGIRPHLTLNGQINYSIAYNDVVININGDVYIPFNVVLTFHHCTIHILEQYSITVDGSLIADQDTHFIGKLIGDAGKITFNTGSTIYFDYVSMSNLGSLSIDSPTNMHLRVINMDNTKDTGLMLKNIAAETIYDINISTARSIPMIYLSNSVITVGATTSTNSSLHLFGTVDSYLFGFEYLGSQISFVPGTRVTLNGRKYIVDTAEVGVSQNVSFLPQEFVYPDEYDRYLAILNAQVTNEPNWIRLEEPP